MEIHVPQHKEMSDHEKAIFSTETAFSSLTAEAIKLGLIKGPVPNLAYLYDHNVILQFQTACKAVLDCIIAHPVTTVIVGRPNNS